MKKIRFNNKQKSFFFNDFYKKSPNDINKVSEERVFFLFFSVVFIISIFFLKILIISTNDRQIFLNQSESPNFKELRKEIVDRNGILLAKNIEFYDIAIRPAKVKNKKNFALKIKYIFPEIDLKELHNKILGDKFFYVKRRATLEEKEKIWALGEKGVNIEIRQSRVYPQENLFSHIIGQIDDENHGISGIEKYYNKMLRDKSNSTDDKIELTLDTNIQHILREELANASKTFNAIGAAGLLMNIHTGEIISLVSLPDYNINLRKNILSDQYANKITSDTYELGSVFKTFTIALALESLKYQADTMLENIPDKKKCSRNYEISEHDDLPDKLTINDILVRSSNIGSAMLANKIGKDDFTTFLAKLNLIHQVDLDLNELGSPLPIKWNNCTLDTISYGHGFSTTVMNVALAYAYITNGGYKIKPRFIKIKNDLNFNEQLISSETSNKINLILRKVVSDPNGTGSLADVDGLNVGGKTGTAYKNLNGQYTKQKLNSFVSIFPVPDPKYVLYVLIDEPKANPDFVYETWREHKNVKTSRNDAGWNAAYIAGKVLKKIGPILAINYEDLKLNVAKKIN